MACIENFSTERDCSLDCLLCYKLDLDFLHLYTLSRMETLQCILLFLCGATFLEFLKLILIEESFPGPVFWLAILAQVIVFLTFKYEDGRRNVKQSDLEIINESTKARGLNLKDQDNLTL